MARFPCQFSAQDQQGRTIIGGTVTVTLTGTDTTALVYEASTGGSAVPNAQFTTDDVGHVKFWADEEDYTATQFFRITIAGARFKTTVIDDVVIYPGTSADAAAAAAAASAAAALVSENNAADSETATNADVVTTNADVVLTGLDVVDTNADVVSTNADVVSTGNDVTATNADVVSTNADVVLTGLDVVSTGDDVTATNADVVLTGLDVVDTNADAASTAQDSIDTNNDLTATNADVVSTNADVVLTGLDVVSTGDDVTATNADVVSTNADVATTAAQVGAVAFGFVFDNSVVMADPGVGDVRLNNAAINNTTAIAFDATSADSGNPDISDFIASWSAGSNSVHEGYITIKKSGAPSTFAVFSITGAVVDNAGWLQCPVTYVDHNGSFTAADALYISYTRSGDKGETGAQGAEGPAGSNEGTEILSTGEGGAVKFLREDGDDTSSWQTIPIQTKEGTAILSTGEGGAVKFLREDGDGTCSWQAAGSGTPEGTAILSTGEGATKYLRADGDNSSSWQTVPGGDVVDDVTPQLGGHLDVNGKEIQSPDTTDAIILVNGTLTIETASTSRMDITDAGVRLGAANARVTTILDDDTMSADSATALCTEQSIKAYVDAETLTQGTSQATTSGTSKSFTGLPSGTKLIRLSLYGVSTGDDWGTLVQIGDSGGFETSGYISEVSDNGFSAGDTSGYLLQSWSESWAELSGIFTLTNEGGNRWVASYVITDVDNGAAFYGGGDKTLSGELTQIRIYNGQSFDLGSINIQYE